MSAPDSSTTALGIYYRALSYATKVDDLPAGSCFMADAEALLIFYFDSNVELKLSWPIYYKNREKLKILLNFDAENQLLTICYTISLYAFYILYFHRKESQQFDILICVCLLLCMCECVCFIFQSLV